MSDDPIRLLIADDHPVFRDGLAALLSRDPGIEVVAGVATGREAIDLAASLLPDVVLMDVGLPIVNGIEATREIVATSPHIAVLILSMFGDDDTVFAAMRAGARGYLLKDADHGEVSRAVHAVAHNGVIFGASVAGRLLGFFIDAAASAQRLFPSLTDREREVLELLAQGRNNADIARALMVASKTVRNHISNIFAKLQVADRAEAIIRARDAGLGAKSRPGHIAGRDRTG